MHSFEYPHGEVVSSGFDVDGTQNSSIGYGPQISSRGIQAQVYIFAERRRVTAGGRAPLRQCVASAWSYDDAAVQSATVPAVNGAFRPGQLKAAKSRMQQASI